MPRTHIVTIEEANEIKELRQTIKDKKVDKRLYAVQLRGEGKKNKEIGEKLDTSPDVISEWVCMYKKGGIDALLPKQRVGNHRNMTYEEETELLEPFFERARNGEIVSVSEIKKAYEAIVGVRKGKGQIYNVLKRHGWRKVMPRSRHEKKADDEAINASKKLTQSTSNSTTV